MLIEGFVGDEKEIEKSLKECLEENEKKEEEEEKGEEEKKGEGENVIDEDGNATNNVLTNENLLGKS